MSKILYSVARTDSGEIVNAANAEKAEHYFCGFCSGPFVLRKSGKTGPGAKRPHFAHKVLTPNCTPESALHFEFKNRLAETIEQYLSDSKELILSWECSYCYRDHTGNLIKTARRVALEHWLGECRPDVALLNDSGKLVAAIEVVVTHRPEESVREFYRQNKIVLIELHLKSETDLDNVIEKLANADVVDVCLNGGRCPKCFYFQQPIVMRIIDVSCHSCNSKIRVPFIEGDHARGSHIGPDGFSQEERELAKSHGAKIEWQYSRTLNTKYWAATCGRCNKFVGRNYLFTSYVSLANYGEYQSTEIPLGYFCENCHNPR